uniref:NADH-ubiquinone oxidoreductase chain 5 n=1 Tax=Nesidiocoris poppiusi TaxID=3059073 RepID=A0AAT9VW09_9HEMI|nr:NADH dehydrogenase subunit 5 [Nesidiocoris poppiusi]WKW91654.1 NADH dehydrogenase subunit 5 [Nesidiocoris poppiusi]
MMYMYLVMSFFILIFGVFFLFLGFFCLSNDYMIFMDWELLSLNSCCLNMSIIIDYMSMTFLSFVFLISSMVIMYSYSYMSEDMFNYRFLMLLLMFIMSMMFMIISPNLISILLGWDGLGLVSYCLVVFFQTSNSYNSGMITVLSNRIGDVGILMSIAWMLNFGSWNYIYYMDFFLDSWVMTYLLVISSFTKSAQIPFSSWLPAAMAAPTPVSALVHSSTLVTAGVYLLIRFSSFLYNLDMFYFMIISLLTMFMSGFGANFEFDLKKIIALSTLSQLGLMMSILFMGFCKLAFFHLLSHAFFKALLFLCAGLIIHSMNNSQDIRDMGYVSVLFPYTSTCLFISSMSLCGAPMMSGYYSKDMVLEYFSMTNTNLIVYVLLMVSILLTVSYSSRLFMYLMYKNSSNYSAQSFMENSYMVVSMNLLVYFSIFLGWALTLILFKTPIFIMLPVMTKLMPLISMFLGLFLGMVFYMNTYDFNLTQMLFFLGGMWFLPKFSTNMLSPKILYLSKFSHNIIDSGWSEWFFSKSHFSFFILCSIMNNFYEKNNMKLYMVSFIFIFFIFII